MDYGGGDYKQVLMPSGSTAEMCQTKCCDEDQCLAFTFAPSCPFSNGTCIKGRPCCFLKNRVTLLTRNNIVSSGSVTHIKPLAPQIKNASEVIPDVDRRIVNSIKIGLKNIIKERPEIIEAIKEVWNERTIQSAVKEISIKPNTLDRSYNRNHDQIIDYKRN
jgi:hypothetical protein